MTVESTIARANEEITSGRLWRAKEILSSSLITYGYNSTIYVAYADVLLKLGDNLTAGKYYLLTIDEPDEAQRQAIELFLTRHRKRDWRQLLSLLPRAAQLKKRDHYPSYFRSHLSSMQAPELLDQGQVLPSALSVWTTRLLRFGCLLAIVVTAVCAVVGAYIILIGLLQYAS